MESVDTPQAVLQLIAHDEWRMRALVAASSLGLPDWWIGAGFVRNAVWDFLHGFSVATPLNDLDLIYFDARVSEGEADRRLRSLAPDFRWEVTNQATVHEWNRQAPYRDSVDALSRWTETATCVAVNLTAAPLAGFAGLAVGARGFLNLAAPYGVDDLCRLVLRLTKHPEAKREVFESRVRTRGWLERWTRLRLIEG